MSVLSPTSGNYLWDGAAFEKWHSDTNNAGLVVLQDGSGSNNSNTAPVFTRRRVVTGISSSSDPDGTDADLETNSASAPTSADYQIRDTATHTIAIPVTAAGFTNVAISLRRTSNFDQAPTFTLKWANGPSSNKSNGGTSTIESFALSTGTWTFTVSAGAVGSGGSTAINGGHKDVPAMGIAHDYLVIEMTCSVSPTTGDYTLQYKRW